jgi:hypothetical protein
MDPGSHVGFQISTKKKYVKNQPIRNKSRLWRLCLLMDRDEMGHLYREPSIDASYQVLVHLVKIFKNQQYL